MINVFRKIRRQLANENKFSKYMRYAVGEIVLVVIGILIALQINNWNDYRKNKEQFSAVLEQIYTVLDQDNEELTRTIIQVQNQIKLIDSLLSNPKSIDPNILPYLLYYVDTYPDPFESEISYHLGFLNFDQKDIQQSLLSKSLASYSNISKIDFSSFNIPYTTPLLNALELPYPLIAFGWSEVNHYENIVTTFFDETQKQVLFSVLNETPFKNALKSLKNQKIICLLNLNNINDTALTNMKLIKGYAPNVKLLYQNIGILGDATTNGYEAENIPLKITNEKLSVWEGDITLHQGTVKFREGNNWTFNWGGSTFPKGKSISYGNNIIVEPGDYHVILNLTSKTYEFIKQKN